MLLTLSKRLIQAILTIINFSTTWTHDLADAISRKYMKGNWLHIGWMNFAFCFCLGVRIEIKSNSTALQCAHMFLFAFFLIFICGFSILTPLQMEINSSVVTTVYIKGIILCFQNNKSWLRYQWYSCVCVWQSKTWLFPFKHKEKWKIKNNHVVLTQHTVCSWCCCFFTCERTI